jgi:excisionase family DNA binding protein
MQEKYVSIEELAEYFSVSASTVRAWIRHGQLTSDNFLKVGSTYRFRISEIENALRGKDSKAPVESITNAATKPAENTQATPNTALKKHPYPTSNPTSSWASDAKFLEALQSGLNFYEDVLGRLTPRDSDIYRLRTDQRMTFVEIGRRVNLTRQSVARIFYMTLRKFKHPQISKRVNEELAPLLHVTESQGVAKKQLEHFLYSRHSGLMLLYLIFEFDFND